METKFKFLTMTGGKAGKEPHRHMILDEPEGIRESRRAILIGALSWALILGLSAFLWWGLWRVTP